MKKIKRIVVWGVGIFIFFVMVVTAGLMKEKKKVVDSKVKSTPVVKKINLPRTYNAYNAEIRFNKGIDAFEGIETIEYIHEFNTPTTYIPMKLFAGTEKNVNNREKGYNQLESITIKSAKVNGRDISFVQSETDLVLHLGAPLNYESKVDLTLEFTGTISSAQKKTSIIRNSFIGRGILPQIVPFEENKGWIVNDSKEDNAFAYAEPADYNVTILSPRPVIATGTLQTSEMESENYNKYTYLAKRVREFGIYISDELRVCEYELPQDKNLIIYSNKMMDYTHLVEKISEALAYYSDILGTYPYDQITVIDDAYIEKTWTCPMMMVCNFDVIQDIYSNLYFDIGKQWIPYILCNNPDKYNWINIGLENYIAYRGKMSIFNVKNTVEAKLQKYNKESISKEESLYRETVLRPMLMLAKAESYLGEEKWKSKLREYYKSKAFTTTTNNDLIASVIEDYGGGMPSIKEGLNDY